MLPTLFFHKNAVLANFKVFSFSVKNAFGILYRDFIDSVDYSG